MCARCQVSLGEIGVNCETNSWQPRRLLRPPDPPPPPPIIQQKGSTPGCYTYGGGKSALLFCPWPPSVVVEPSLSLCPGGRTDKLGAKISGSLDWAVRDGPSANKPLSTGEAGWSGLPPHTLQYSKNGTQDERRTRSRLYICFHFTYVSFFSFTFEFSHLPLKDI